MGDASIRVISLGFHIPPYPNSEIKICIECEGENYHACKIIHANHDDL